MYLTLSSDFHVFDLSNKNKCQFGLLRTEGLRSKRLMNNCRTVLRVIGEGMGQRRISAP